MRLGKVLNSLPRRFEDLKSRNKGEKTTTETLNPRYDITVEATGAKNAHGIVEPWLEKATNDHREPLTPLSQLLDGCGNELSDTEQDQSFQALQPSSEKTQQPNEVGLPVIDERHTELIGEDVTNQRDSSVVVPPLSLQLRLPPGHTQSVKQAESDSDTPLSQAVHPLESELSSATVMVNHHAQPSLTFTASIEDYAHKADPKNWGPAKFKKGQTVRIRPGTYAVPFKKRSESRHIYTQLGSYTKGTVHIINKETASSDPREFVNDEREVMYRIWIPGKVNRTVEFIFACQEDMSVFTECAACGGFATEFCSGCNKVRYCSEYCISTDWKIHKADCAHKGKTHPVLGTANLSDRSVVSVSTNSNDAKNKQGSQTGQPPQAPWRKFRPDGTVKVVNGYKPPPETLQGRTIVLPKCLRPLTVDEQNAPEPSSYILRLARKQSHRLRNHLHRNKLTQVTPDTERTDGAMTDPEITPEDGGAEGAEMTNLDVPYSAGKSPLGRSSRMGYHNDDRSTSLDLDNRTADGTLYVEEDDNEPSSGKSAESVVEGGPSKNHSNERSLFSRTFFARLPPIRTSHDASKPITEADAPPAAGSSEAKPQVTVSFQNKIPKALKKLSRRPSAQGDAVGPPAAPAAAPPRKGIIAA